MESSMETMWVADTEGSGSNPNEPIELGIVEMQGYELTGKAHVWRFKPMQPIQWYATRVHGITNKEINGEPAFAECRDEVMALLGNRCVIGHAVNVELDMITSVEPSWAPPRAYDTLRMAKRLYPDQKQHKLSVLGEQFGLSEKAEKLTGKKVHNALYDAVLTALLLKHFASEHPDQIERLMQQADIMSGRRSKAERKIRKEQTRIMREKYKRLL